ncbi:ABC transporter ATP-binding protein [Stappia sp. F7233]|uniref:ABC transporter ATP-binding protein n=2 Tax=Stappia albiluteola TaxID=2758565 RepID=A0A839A880_9HYPH|nr:ABC transporter ATP-binding protein [Stappia albiluteola]
MPSDAVGFLLYFVSQARGVFLAMLILGGLTALIEAALYVFVGDLVDLMQQGEREGFFLRHAGLLLLMAAAVLVFRSLVAVLTALVEEQAVVPGFFNLVRLQSHDRIMRQSLGYFQDEFAGRISQKVWQAGQAAGDFMVSLLQVIWYIVVFALSTLTLLGGLDGSFALLIALWLGFFALTARFFVPKIRARARAVSHAGSGITGRLVDTYSNIQTVKLFGDLGREEEGLKAGYLGFLGTLRTFTRTLTGVRAAMSVLSGLMIVSIAAMAIQSWQGGRISAGDVAVVMGLVLRLNILLNRLMGQMNGLFRALGTLQDSADMITRKVTLTDHREAVPLRVGAGRIEFRNASFHYGRDDGVLENLSLTIEPGERVGIVGRSGAGKSTLANLLLRFFDLESGGILVDGQDISRVTQTSLRAAVGMVTQDTSLLHRSIRENIVYGRPEADDAAIRAAAVRAHADGFIQALEDKRGRKGYDAFVGERGVKLSGGQRQRIAIARVLLKDAPILVLDEATSALDSEIEAAIQESLSELMEGKTVIAIAHRLSTIAAMDRLVVMDEGRIVEEGTHKELIARGGLYADLWKRQSGGFIAAGRAA